MSVVWIGGVVLALAAAAADVRIVLWWRRAPPGERSAPWRVATLLAAQPLMAGLLFLALLPPAEGGEGAGTLVVATRGAPRLLAAGAGERLVVLPEAPAGLDGEAAPDLATALRRHPDAVRLRVVGAGLAPRDREAVGGRALAFDPAPLPRGLVELTPPGATAPGAPFRVTGRINGVDGAMAELLDPAGHVADSRPAEPDGRFELAGAAREPGPALFAVRVRDRARAEVQTVDAPVVVAADAAPRTLLLAGAAGPEVKALRRWAADAGVDLRAVVSAGAGLELGDPRPPLAAAGLDRLDLVIVDERSWASMGAADRAALEAAVTRGLGLLLRITGPVPASVREQWAALGLPLTSGEAAAPVRLAAAPVRPGEADIPELTRWGADTPAPGSAPLLRAADGAVLARWRPRGQGRLGVWIVGDSSGLTTAGFGDRYGELWSTLTALGRAGRPPAATVAGSPVAGRRTTVCGLSGEAGVSGPGSAPVRLVPDAGSGQQRCAGYWPTEAGWRTLTAAGGVGGVSFYVRPPDQAPGLAAEEDRLATAAMVTDPSGRAPRLALASGPRAPRWAWFLAWLLAAGATWWLERARAGRPSRPG